MNFVYKVLLVTDDSENAKLVEETLRHEGWRGKLLIARDKNDFPARLAADPDMILCDYDSKTGNAIEFLQLARQENRQPPFLVIADVLDNDSAQECIRAGATDCLLKNRIAWIGPAIIQAVLENRIRFEQNQPEIERRPLAEAIERKSEARDPLPRRLMDVWSASTDGICLADHNGTVLAASNGYCEITRMKEAEIVGRPFWACFSYIDGNGEAEARRYHEKIAGLRGAERIEQRVRFMDGREADLEITYSPFDFDDGMRGALHVLRDITEQKFDETQSARARHTATIGALVGGIAHDFNNILSPIIMAESMLRLNLSPADRDKALRTIGESARRGVDVINGLLNFAKEIGSAQTEIDLASIVDKVERMISRTFHRKIRLETSIARDIPHVLADATQIYQVLLNFCANARDAMPDGGALRLRLEAKETDNKLLDRFPQARSGRFAVLSVEDTGNGLAPEFKERLFGSFFSTKAAASGIGIDIAITRWIIRNHGGFIIVDSDPGKGTLSQVFLPLS